VKRNPESDALLGVTTARAESGPDGLTVPSTALVDANGKPLLFVQTDTTFDPVYVQTGANQGDRVVVSEGIDPTDDIVIAGALSLYAESMKTQQAEEPAAEAGAATQPEATQPEAPQPEAGATKESSKLPPIAAGAGIAVVVAAGAVLLSRRGKQGE
jgi:cation efflux system membrane fusion protein